VARAHAVVAVIEDGAGQQSVRVCSSCTIAIALLGKFLPEGKQSASGETSGESNCHGMLSGTTYKPLTSLQPIRWALHRAVETQC
jgi:hypothetical protein